MNKSSFEAVRNTAQESDIRFDATDRVILEYLAEHEPATVTEIVRAIGSVSRTVVFYRLLTFKGAGLVTSYRKSRSLVHYSLRG
ncbi:MAG: helix-turn-helix domain-containing protein [Halobacteriota archaeon]|jgi:DNA-binding transcriptional ArsR family regulator